MKIPREAMTPTLDAALLAFVGDGSWFGPASSERPGEPDRARALLRRQRDLESALAYGFLFSFLAAGITGLLLLGGETPALLLVPGTILTGTLALARKTNRSQPDGACPTPAFLAAALPRLHIPPVQRRYAEAVVAIYSGEARDPGGDGLSLLRHLAEEEQRLLALSRTVDMPEATMIHAEAEGLRLHLANARDPAAREAYAQSLSLAQRRLITAERASGVRERLDAHRILLEQASRTASEGIKGWSDLAAGLDDLRANVVSLGQEASALEAAVQEMKALSGDPTDREPYR